MNRKRCFEIISCIGAVSLFLLIFCAGCKRRVIDPTGYVPVVNPEQPQSFSDGLSIEFIPIPGGTGAIGHIDAIDESSPLFEEEFKPFYLASAELTVAQWKKYFKVNKSHGWGMWGTVERYCPNDDCPIVCLSKLDCEEFCKTMSQIEGVTYRLPTEFEWEYAARLGDSDALLGKTEFYNHIAGYEHAFPVRTLPANKLGFYGMTSNALEWTSSDFLPYPDSKFYHPLYKKMAYVLRGGSFRYQTEIIRRIPSAAKIRNYTYGLRVVREME